MKDELLFCLVGRGSIGTRHLKNLQSLSYNKIIAFSESDDENKDAEYREKYGVKTYHDMEEIKKMKPDAFLIANPTAKHMRFADIAVDMNCHVFMEKPISHNLLGIQALKRKLAEKNLVFVLGSNLRFHPAFIEIKRLIKDGKFGKVYFSRFMAGQYLPDWHPCEDYRNSYSAKKELGGGVVLTLQHEIDYARWFFGEFKNIQSFVKKISDLEIDVEDIASIIIETASDQLIEIHLDYLQRPSKRTLHIQGEKGSVDYCFGDRYLRFHDFKKQKSENVLDLKGYDNNLMYVDEIKHFINGIVDNEKPVSDIDDAIYVLKVCMGVKEGFNY